MSLKLALLKSGETLISDIKEMVYERPDGEKEVYGYLFAEPKKVDLSSPVFLSEETSQESSVQVSLSSWCLISKDKEFAIPKDWIVTFMEPFEIVSDGSLVRWPTVTDQRSMKIHSDSILTIVDPTQDILAKYKEFV